MAIKVEYKTSHGNKQSGSISDAIYEDASKITDYYARGLERDVQLAESIAKKNSVLIEKIVEYLVAKSDGDDTLLKIISDQLGVCTVVVDEPVEEDEKEED